MGGPADSAKSVLLQRQLIKYPTEYNQSKIYKYHFAI